MGKLTELSQRFVSDAVEVFTRRLAQGSESPCLSSQYRNLKRQEGRYVLLSMSQYGSFRYSLLKVAQKIDTTDGILVS